MDTPIFNRLTTATLALRTTTDQADRDRTIVQASHMGLSNASIGAITRLSSRTVGRILHPAYWAGTTVKGA